MTSNLQRRNSGSAVAKWRGRINVKLLLGSTYSFGTNTNPSEIIIKILVEPDHEASGRDSARDAILALNLVSPACVCKFMCLSPSPPTKGLPGTAGFIIRACGLPAEVMLQLSSNIPLLFIHLLWMNVHLFIHFSCMYPSWSLSCLDHDPPTLQVGVIFSLCIASLYLSLPLGFRV